MRLNTIETYLAISLQNAYFQMRKIPTLYPETNIPIRYIFVSAISCVNLRWINCGWTRNFSIEVLPGYTPVIQGCPKINVIQVKCWTSVGLLVWSSKVYDSLLETIFPAIFYPIIDAKLYLKHDWTYLKYARRYQHSIWGMKFKEMH